MFKINKKLLISISAAAALSLGLSACMESASPKASNTPLKASIDGGVTYSVANGKFGTYYVNEKAHNGIINFGRTPTKAEYDEWNSDVMASGEGLPEGEGSVEDGEEVYEAKCVMCHGDFGSGGGGYPSLSKGNAYELHKTLTNQRIKPDTDGPVRVFGTYWPKASTLWWYIKDAMPHPQTDSLTDDEVYALVAYILNANEMEIDGVEVDDEYVLNRKKFLKIKMPNENGFEPNIAGPNAPENIRKYYSNAKNFGGQTYDVKNPASRCMKDCQEPTAKVSFIKGAGISDFHPPLSEVRDLPKEKKDSANFDAEKAYADNCAMCHDTGAAPAPGDKAGWAALTAKGMDKVYAAGIKGTEAGMPAKGGSSLSDNEFKSVVDYIVNQSK
ncbi:c-type cytochrome [Sulfurimonas autotrophica]|uniref:Cytochrome c class I n=1 Tax=Sulfurimonas autotrophica (strain ATCC BAA-671 / DSM 16294 / JCM 11897 / OK10) TaxID=563040 RepID=E0URX5_SULAO|nr:c-type cytochrome [Sulfurimonas autotrophica]ADN10139.1 cytochrome c class I [Sulfurimonas autotrophica DSM 16294]